MESGRDKGMERGSLKQRKDGRDERGKAGKFKTKKGREG